MGSERLRSRTSILIGSDIRSATTGSIPAKAQPEPQPDPEPHDGHTTPRPIADMSKLPSSALTACADANANCVASVLDPDPVSNHQG